MVDKFFFLEGGGERGGRERETEREKGKIKKEKKN